MCRSQRVHESVLESLDCVFDEFKGRKTCTSMSRFMSLPRLSKQQVLIKGMYLLI